jgi:hypothetical protein
LLLRWSPEARKHEEVRANRMGTPVGGLAA